VFFKTGGLEVFVFVAAVPTEIRVFIAGFSERSAIPKAAQILGEGGGIHIKRSASGPTSRLLTRVAIACVVSPRKPLEKVRAAQT
jgi:hypothetical protein